MEEQKKVDNLIIEIHMLLGNEELAFIGKSPISIQDYPDIRIEDISSVYLFERKGKENLVEIDVKFDNGETRRLTAKTSLSGLGTLTFGPKVFIRQPYTIDDEIRESVREMHGQGHDFSDLERSVYNSNPYQ